MLMPSIFSERLFDDFFDNRRLGGRSFSVSSPMNNLMRTDVKETDEGFELEIDLPGFSKDDVKGELKDGFLTISASNSHEHEEKNDEGQKFIRRERFYGSCERTFNVGEDITLEDIKARFENGILKLFIPKKEVKPEIPEKQYISIEG